MGTEPLIADGFDACILGRCHNSGRVIYSMLMMLEQTAREIAEDAEDGEDPWQCWEDAYEHLSYNVWTAWVGEGTPIYLDDIAKEQEDFDRDHEQE